GHASCRIGLPRATDPRVRAFAAHPGAPGCPRLVTCVDSIMMLCSLSLHVLCPLPAPGMMPALPAAMTVVEADSLLDAARAALARGQAWRATWMLAPVVSSPERRTPEAVLLSATAASLWSGWDEVHRLLEP